MTSILLDFLYKDPIFRGWGLNSAVSMPAWKAQGLKFYPWYKKKILFPKKIIFRGTEIKAEENNSIHSCISVGNLRG